MVIFNSNDGTNNTYNQVLFYNQSQKLITKRFTRSGYTFEGWATEVNGAVKYKDSESVKFTLQNNTTQNLYAVWSYGSSITDSNVESLKLSSLEDEYIVRVKGQITQNTIDTNGYKLTNKEAGEITVNGISNNKIIPKPDRPPIIIQK